jgi:hypothetical protein
VIGYGELTLLVIVIISLTLVSFASTVLALSMFMGPRRNVSRH